MSNIKPYFSEDVIAILRSVLFSAGTNASPEFTRAIIAVALAFGIRQDELEKGK